MKMKLSPAQRRVLAWLADPSNEKDPQSIADGTGYVYDTVIVACSVLKQLGLIVKEPVVTDAGKELLIA